ncbi:ABC transporter permease subunit [Bacillus marinisedimentorum]|uniref:ABC transporter permease subunit n=1 Tax=Bacillus marinisedimentorum TaxID=1821260 RepID=UPI000873053F|nr:ABC transporter permease subunit [Bacillus marinisedimentorum]
MIYKREVLKSQKSLWIWVAALGGLIFLMLSIYPEFAKQQESIEKMMEAYPEGMLKAFNIDELGFSTVLGFYAIEGYLFVTLFGSIYVSIMAANMLVKEEGDKTAEFLLSKPVTRTRIVTEKLLAVLTNILIFNGAISLINYLGFRMSGDDSVDAETFALISAAPLLLHLTFGGIAFMASSFLRKNRMVVSLSLGLVLVTYFLDIVQGLAEKLENLKYLTPFEYVDPAYIINNSEIKPLYLAIMTAIIILSTISAYMIYRRKDITV